MRELDETEIRKLAIALGRVELDGRAREDKLEKLIDWITSTRIQATQQQMLIDGKILVDITGDDPDEWLWVKAPDAPESAP